MTASTGTGKYEQLLERCRSLAPVPTAIAHPCEETALAGAIEAGAKGLIVPILVGPAAKIQEIAQKAGIALGHDRDRRRPAQPCGGGQSRRARAQGRGRAADERAACTPTSCSARSWRARPDCAPDAASATCSSWTCRPITRSSSSPTRPSTSRRRSRTRPTSARTRSTWRSRSA